MKKEEYFWVVGSLLAIVFGAFIVSAAPSWQAGFAGTIFNVTEDTIISFNFSQNVSNPSNEGLEFRIEAITVVPDLGLGNNSLNYPWFSINSLNGNLSVNSTRDNQTGYFTLTVNVRNSSNLAGQSDLFYFNVTAINDRPSFQNISNSTFNMSEQFNTMIRVVDEENNYPFSLNISFVSCNVAQWSTRNCSNEQGRELFNSTQYSFNSTSGYLNISFIPERNDVGSYIISFNATDSGSVNTPYNASFTQLVNYTVTVVNSRPYFRYVCDNERQTTENSLFSCYINASDIDETNNLTILSKANGTFSFVSGNWFTFNSTNNLQTLPVNISTMFNASWLVNFTTDDFNVGNWSINITVNDTGYPNKQNSTLFYFLVANVNDLVYLDNISAVTAYMSNNYTLFLNASDDDLLIPDKSVYNEVLTFYSNHSSVTISSYSNSSNITTSRISFNPNNLAIGFNQILINVSDMSGNSDFTVFNITVVNNTAPSWKAGTKVNFTLSEESLFTLNLTENVTDLENDALTFSYTNYSYFPRFNLSSPGIINFTSNDLDVGIHSFVVNVSDGIASSSLSFTFEVFNLNETPLVAVPLIEGYNVTVNITSNALNFSEDSSARFFVYVQDEDFKVPSSQKSYYNESITLNASITGPITNLFSFVLSQSPSAGSNLSIYSATFSPNKSAVGSYNVSLNVTDLAGNSSLFNFSFTVTDINHFPNVTSISNQTTIINRTFSIDFNATDIEDGGENGNLTFDIDFLQGNDFINNNQTIFNSTNGLLNITFNDSQAGSYSMNLTVNDSTGKQTSIVIYLKVYDFPTFISPALNSLFNLTEMLNSNLSFVVNHSIGDNLNYSFYINQSLRYNVLSFGNTSMVNWSFTPNYTDETFGISLPLTAYVSNLVYPELNSTLNLSVNISHSNAPISFNGSIPNYQRNYDQTVNINLSNYFSDIDSSDVLYNQTLNFTVVSNMSSNSSITASVSNGSISENSISLVFSASSVVMESFNITVNDSQYQNYSNQFTISFTQPSSSSSSTSTSRSSGGGGGSSQVKPVSLNIIVPGQLTAKKQDRLIVPVSLVNTGQITLTGVVLRNSIAKNGILREDLLASFDTSFFESLAPKESKNLTLIVDINTREKGLYEVTLNGTSVSPVYSDTSKLYINVEEGDTIAERISFTQEFIAQNPQCIEIKEIIDEARELYIKGDTVAATDKADEALNACKQFIAQSARAQVRDRIYQSLTDNIGITALLAIGLGVGYYWFRRFMLQREYHNVEGKL